MSRMLLLSLLFCLWTPIVPAAEPATTNALATPEPPPLAVLGQPGETIYQTAVPLKQPKKSADRIDGGLHHVVFSLWLPEGEACVRGIYLMPFNITGVQQEQSRAMCRHWKFALVGGNFMRVNRAEFGPTLLAGLKDLARQSQHPEIEHAPLVAASMSAGVGMCVSLAEQLPERFIACGLVCLEVGPETKGTRDVPMMSIFGERDGKQMIQHEERLPQRRTDAEAKWAIAVQWGRRHEWGQANNLLWPFFDDVIRQRLPHDALPLTGPVQLRPCDPSLTWLSDPTTWKERTARIAPAGETPQDQATKCWLPGPLTAHAWQAFVVREPLLRIVSPASQGDKRPLPVFKADETITLNLEADAQVADRKIEIYDGATSLAASELKERRATLNVGPLAPGIYTLIVRSQLADQSLALSRPVVILVKEQSR